MAVWLALGACASPLHAEVHLPQIFGSDMVLQREMPVPVWGWADAGETITVEFAGQRQSVVADAEGRWKTRLEPMPASAQPRDLIIGDAVAPRRQVFHNVLVGEVWLCSGQSNMEWGVGMEKNGAAIIATADHPLIRLFKAAHAVSYERERDLPRIGPDFAAGNGLTGGLTPIEREQEKNANVWRPCSPVTIAMVGWKGFSCAAYFFALDLQARLKVPVGLVAAAYGGSDIASFTPMEGYALVPERADWKQRGTTDFYKEFVARHPKMEAWYEYVKYNAMIHPLVPFAIRGALWHQGESDVGRGKELEYFYALKALIGGWRAVWGQGDFSFYYVMTGPYRSWKGDELPRHWMSQLAALTIPNTGYVVTTDIGEPWDLHPFNKDVVGHRLARWALAKTYGCTDVVCSGPIYKGMRVEGRIVHVDFDGVGGGLVASDGRALTHFEVAGADQVFVPATATIHGAQVFVQSDAVAQPKAVRFAWTWNNPNPPAPVVGPNLFNKEGLPAAPFTSDPLSHIGAPAR